MSRVVVIGLGVVGLPTALLLAHAGHVVIGVDINEKILSLLKKAILPPQVKEEKLQSILSDPKVRKNLHFQTTPTKADIFLIAVPTPLDSKKKKADLSFVKKASQTVTSYLEKGNLVIIESTIPPLTCRNFIAPILEKSKLKIGKDIFLAHCPERVLPGNAYYEIVNNDRIVGGVDEQSSKKAKRLYTSFVKGNIFTTNDVTAELCKLMENSYRDINIALANEFSLVSENLGVDPKEVIKLANRHPRVNILNPGIGVGGHCIPVDPWFIYEVDPLNSQLISASRKINDKRPYKIAEMIKNELKGVKNPKIIAIGAAYKPNTGDIRESPAVAVVKILTGEGFHVSHFDPLIDEYRYRKSLLHECLGKDLLVILVPHKVVTSELNKNEEKIQEALSTHKILQF